MSQQSMSSGVANGLCTSKSRDQGSDRFVFFAITKFKSPLHLMASLCFEARMMICCMQYFTSPAMTGERIR